MGAYLTKPKTEKISSDESNDYLICGASAMQGWRQNQEVTIMIINEPNLSTKNQ